MPSVASPVRRVLSSPDLRMLAVMVAGVAVCGVLDGSFWKGLLTPTIAYRPAFLFGLTLIFGWRGFVWSQLIFLASFGAFLGWRGAVFVTPLYLLSHACALVVARRIARDQPWLSSERSTAAFLAGAVLAPAIPALLGSPMLSLVGIVVGPGVPAAIDSWIRGGAASLALVPALLVFCSRPLQKWVGLRPERSSAPSVDRRKVLEIGAETAICTLTLWISVGLKAKYGLNVTYLTFLPPLAFTFFRGMNFAVLALAANTIVATTLWQQLHWAGSLSAVDLRLLIAICSITILVLAAVVDEREHSRVEVEALRTAENALRVSEERFRFAQKAASIGTFEWNIETGSNLWTPELEALYGLPPGSFLRTRKAWEELIHPDDLGRVLQRITKSIETAAPTQEEWRVIWPDRSLHWIAGRWQVFKNAKGEPCHVLGINIDVTERKNMDEALRTTQERFRLATMATNDAIWDLDLKTGTVSWNDTYSLLFGAPKTANAWQFWIDHIHPEDRARTVEGLHASIDGSAVSWSAEYRFRCVDGEWAHIHDRAYIARDASGNASRMIGAMQDLTERKKAEAALRESEERFRRVFDEGPLGLALVGKDYRFQKVNVALCQMLGYPEAELLQVTFADVTHPDDLQTDLDLAERLFRGEMPFYQRRKRYLKKSGDIVWVNLTASVIRNAEGEPSYGLAMMEDITELKRTQEEAFARQKLESVGVLAEGIAHDFNNLLGGILAHAELVETDVYARSAFAEEIQNIRAAAIRGSEIVRGLMIYAGRGQDDVREPVDVSPLVEEMLELLKVSISKHAVLRRDLRADLPPVWGNAPQIRQIVMNLVINASEAIRDKEGVITVSTTHVTGGRDLAPDDTSDLAVGDYVQLEVSDTGCGITKEAKEKIFEPFFTTKFAGRGLGLAVVQGIVRAHGGGIDIVSAPGEGTVFKVFLPCAPKPASVAPRAITLAEIEQRSVRTATILVVEDEETLRQAFSKALPKRGFSVIEAKNGSEAVELIRARKDDIDAVLLDFTLPGVSSREVLQETLRVRPDMKVILTSAYGVETVAASLVDLPVEHFIRKPFGLEDLVRMLESALAANATARLTPETPKG